MGRRYRGALRSDTLEFLRRSETIRSPEPPLSRLLALTEAGLKSALGYHATSTNHGESLRFSAADPDKCTATKENVRLIRKRASGGACNLPCYKKTVPGKVAAPVPPEIRMATSTVDRVTPPIPPPSAATAPAGFDRPTRPGMPNTGPHRSRSRPETASTGHPCRSPAGSPATEPLMRLNGTTEATGTASRAPLDPTRPGRVRFPGWTRKPGR